VKKVGCEHEGEWESEGKWIVEYRGKKREMKLVFCNAHVYENLEKQQRLCWYQGANNGGDTVVTEKERAREHERKRGRVKNKMVLQILFRDARDGLAIQQPPRAS